MAITTLHSVTKTPQSTETTETITYLLFPVMNRLAVHYIIFTLL